jgi:hypothetical protein
MRPLRLFMRVAVDRLSSQRDRTNNVVLEQPTTFGDTRVSQ